VPVVKSGRQHAGEELLQQVRRAEIVVALDALDGCEQRFGQNAEADARAGRIGLAVSAGVNHALRRAGQRERGRHVVTVVKSQFAIRGVFEQINRMSGGALEFFQQLQHGGFFREAGRRAGGILKIGDEVKRLHAAEFAGFFQPFQNFFEMNQINAVAFEFHAARLDTATLENAQENKIGRVFDEDDVAFVAERFERHVKQLLRAARNHDARWRVSFARGICAVEFLEMLRGERAQIGFAGGNAVLQSGPAGFWRTQNVIEQLARNFDGQSGIVRESGGERNEPGPRERGLHEPRDRRHGGALTQFGQDVWFHVKRLVTIAKILRGKQAAVCGGAGLDDVCQIVAGKLRWRKL
jgi:hypothetical protein